MKVSVSDLVIFKGHISLVTKVDLYLQLATLVDPVGAKVEAPLEEVQVQAHPSTDWYLIMVPIKPKAGRVVGIKIPSLRGAPTVLTPWYDWVPADPIRAGGSIYLRDRYPAGTTFLVTHESGVVSKVVAKKLLTVGEMVAKANPTKEAPKSRYDRLLEDDD